MVEGKREFLSCFSSRRPTGPTRGREAKWCKREKDHKYESASTPKEGWLPSACPEKKKAKQKRILRERERRN